MPSVVHEKHCFKRLHDVLYANANDLFDCFCFVMYLSTKNEFIVFKFSVKFALRRRFYFLCTLKIKEVIVLESRPHGFLDHPVL